ncbi:hypothetical protein P5673_014023 [Acropora cervicornis]|uniref:Uncharacterized protein n=1 Tax=Acropora cervicornis TaxID=6130 RepID=A0AAD9QKM2_ACRCE|nr:hypothetical protein P5673_014023 [Acropora cervicornis]
MSSVHLPDDLFYGLLQNGKDKGFHSPIKWTQNSFPAHVMAQAYGVQASDAAKPCHCKATTERAWKLGVGQG